MQKLLSKVLALLILVSSMANPIPVFSMVENQAELQQQDLEQISVSQAVYASEVTPAETPTQLSTPTPTGDIYGNDFDTATLIEADTEYIGSIEDSSDVDYFKFIPDETGMYSFETTGTSNTYGYLYNDKRSQIASGSNEGIGNNIFITYKLIAGMEYYLRLHSNNVLVPYTLKVSKLEDDIGNDSESAYPIEIGTEVTANIDYASDVDYFKFTPTKTGPYKIESTGDIDLTGILVNYRTAYDISSENKNFSIKYTLNANQTYYIYVQNANTDKDYAKTGSYGLLVSQLQDDHGNSTASATLLQLDSEFTAVSEAENEVDYFKFIPDTDGIYAFESTGTADTYAYLYNSSNSQIANSNNEGIGSNYYMVVTLEAKKTYYLRSHSNTYDRAYTVKVSKMVDDHGNNTDTATFIQIGDSIPGEINYAGDIDYFKFVPTVSGPYVIESTGPTDLTGTLQNVATAYDISSTDKNFRMVQALNAGQTYYLYVHHANYNDKDTAKTGEYSIRISAGTDDHGNSYDSATILEIGTQIEAVKESEGDFDYFKFVPEASGMYSIESTGSGDPYGYLYNSSKGQITNDNNSGTGSNFYIAVWLNANETYYIRTSSYNLNVPYKVSVTPLEDDHGYDNNSATELVLDTEVAGEINFTNDTDYFKFTPAETGPYVIESTGSTNVNAYLYNIMYAYDISSTDKNFKITYFLNAGQTYYLQVYHGNSGDKDRANTGAYGVKITQLADDHGNSFDTATEIEVGEEVQAVQESNGDYDYFKFTVETSGMYSIESLGTANTTGYIYNSAQARIEHDSDSGIGTNFYSAVYLEAGKTYYIRTNSSNINVPYKVLVSALTDDHGYDNNSATELVLDTEIEGAINFSGDYDYFKFTPAETGPYVIESTGSTNVNAYLYNIMHAFDISSTNRNFKITYTLNAGQTYYLQVYHGNGADKDKENTGAYGIKISKLADDHGNSFDTATEIEVGEEVQAVQESDGDYDYFKFTVETSGMYGIESSGTGNPYGYIYNSAKSRLTSDNNSGIGNNFYIAIWLKAGETYYIQSYSNTINVPYTVKVSPLTDDHGYDNNSATELLLDTEIAGEINFTNDTDYFKFTPAVSGPYAIESTGNTNVDAYLQNYLNAYDISSTNKNFRIAYTLNAGQTYYIQVYHANRGDKDSINTGAYGIKITQLVDDHGDSYGTATEIQSGDEIQAVQQSDGDYDFFKFVPATSGMYCFESTGSINTTGELYNSNKSLMTRNYDGGIGANFFIASWLEGNKTYYLRVWADTKDVPYFVKVYGVEDDHGYDNSTATVLKPGDEIAGVLNFSNDIDYFVIVPEESAPYVIESISNMDLYGSLSGYRSTSNNDISSENKNFRIAYKLVANKTYYLAVHHNNYSDKDYMNTGAYKIKFTKLTDNFGDNIDTATEVETLKLIKSGIEATNDEDYVKFVALETATYTIESFGSLNLYGRLYNEAKTSLAYNSNSADDGRNFKIVYNLEEGKTYYLSIYEESRGYGNYAFAIYPGADDYKNEINYGTLIQIGVESAGVFNYSGDVDYFRFSPSVDGIYQIRSFGSTDTYCEIYDSIGNMLGSSDNIDDTDKNFSIIQSLPANRTCYVKVVHADPDSGLGEYTIKVINTGESAGDDHGNSFDTATLIEIGSELDCNIDYASDIDFVKFVPDSDGTYLIESTGDNDLLGYLYGEDKALITSDNNSGIGTNYYIPATLEEGKTYYLKTIHISGSATGEYGVKITKVSDDHGNKNSNATVLSVGDELDSSIDYMCDIDVFVFNPELDGPYVFDVLGNGEMRVKLFNQSGIQLYSDVRTDTTVEDLSIPVTLTGGQKYYLRITHKDYLDCDDAGIGAYTLKLSEGTDDHANSFEGATEINVNEIVDGNIESMGDVDIYKFTSATDAIYTITSTGSTNTFGYLYDDKHQLRISDDNSGEGNNFYLSSTLTAGKVYYIKVAHASGTGTGAYKLIITSDLTPPTAPAYLTVTSKAGGTVGLQWTASTDNVGVKGYNIYRDGVKVGSTSQLTYNDTVDAQGLYVYTVRAYDVSGNESTDSPTALFDYQKPSKPEDLRDIASTVTTVQLSWTASQDYEGVGIQGYYIYRDGVLIKTVLENSYTDTGLEPGTSYTYKVSAFDKAGNESDLSDALLYTTPADNEAPSIPQGIKIASKTGSSITVTWNASTDNYKVEGYKVLRNGTEIGTTKGTSYKDRELTEGVSYSYAIVAYDKFGNQSEISSSVSAIPLNPHILRVEPVEGVTVGGNTNQLFRLFFANSNNLAGTTAVFEYTVDGTTWAPFGSNVNGPYTWDSSTAYFYSYLNMSGLTSGSYKLRFVVTDEEGHYDSLEASYNVDRTNPSTPKNIQAVGITGKINISWDVPVDADIAGYRLMRSMTDDFKSSTVYTINGALNNYYDDANVEYGSTYYYKVKAFDKFNQESEYSDVVSASPVVDEIIPVVLGIEPANNTLLGPNANITVRAEDNIAIKSIKLQYSLNGTDWIDIETKNTSGTASFRWNPSPISGDVYVRAIAIDKSGLESDGNPVRTYKVDTTGPEKVTGLSFISHPTYVVLKWNDVSDQDLSYFMVEQKNADGIYKSVGTTSTTLGMNITGLKPDSTYTYRVIAYDRFGNRGIPSEDIIVSTLVDEVAPWITGIGPSPSYFGEKISLWASAKDNASVASVKFQVSTDLNSWDDLTVVTNSAYSASFTARYDYDVSALAEGKIYIRAIAYDGAGLSSPVEGSYTYAEYIIDHTGPLAPEGLSIEPSAGNITLKWKLGSEADIYLYRVYRSETGIEPFELLADKVSSLGYVDRAVEQGKTYYYKVSTIDVAGNEGEASAALSGMVLPDDEAPIVYSVSPVDGTTLPANPRISVVVADNYRLKKITVQYKPFADVEDSWETAYEQDLTQFSENVVFTFNTEGLYEGKYSFRIFATDTSDNVSEYKTVTYDFNLLAPEKPVVTAVAGGWRAELSWDRSEEADLAGYRIYRSTTSGSDYRLIKETTANTLTDEGLTAGISYYYVVEALDIYRNAIRSDEVVVIPTDEDNVMPVAEAGEDQSIAIGVAVWFDGTRSKDNNRISEYLWDFGDGATSTQAQPSHVYTEPGEYTVTLTVKDPAGNSASDTLTVTVNLPQQVGTLEIKVVDDSSGAAIGGSSVVVEYPDGTMQNYSTNGAGVLNVSVPAGEYKVYAYKTDYRPGYLGVAVNVNTKTPVTVKLEKGELVVGELTVRRLTLDEIIDAGIDVTAPENQYVYKFEVHLAFQNKPLPTQELIVNGRGSVITYSPLYIPAGTSGYGGSLIAYPVAIPVPNHPEVRPTVAYMVIPGEARFLKEFFEVGLTLENTADPVFVIEQSKAVLNLPEGLALATTRDPQSLEVDLGDFAGGERKEVKWIIRGDKKGYYTLQADFTGILQPFGEPVAATFKNKEPFRVWGEDALEMHVYAQEEADFGHPYKVIFELKNVSDIPVYYPAIELVDDGKQNYFYAPNQELVKSVVELPAGEKLVKEYTLISAVKGELDLAKSYVLRTGGNISIPSFIHKISAEENYKGNAPIIKETQNSDGTVTLTWGEVENATGYKIYSIRRDLKISVDPDQLVAQVDADTTTYTISESGESMDYIVTTLFDDEEILRHAILKWPYGEDPAPAVVTIDPEVIYAGRSTEVWITSNKSGLPVKGGTAKIAATTVKLDSNGQARVTLTPDAPGELEVKIFNADGDFLVSKKITVIPDDVSGGLIKNPSFSVNTKGWYLWTQSGAVATGVRDTEECDTAPGGYRIDCTSAGTAINHIQLYTGEIKVEQGKRYKLSFMAKSEGGSSSPVIQLMKATSPWNNYSSVQTVQIGSGWMKYSVYFISNTTDNNARITFSLGGRMPNGGKLYIDSISMVEEHELLANPSFESNADGWILWTQSGAVATGERDTTEYDSGSAGYRIDCTNNGTAMNHIQLYTAGINAEAGRRYRLTFRAKSEGGKSTPVISLMQKNSPWAVYSQVKTVTIGSEWTTYEVYLDCNATDNNARLNIYLGDRIPEGGKLYIDSLSMVAVD